jgi:hypothetical protein
MSHVTHSKQNEASAQTLTDSFFFQASAMVPSTQHMALCMELAVKWGSSAAQDLSGHLDYLAVVSKVASAQSGTGTSSSKLLLL